VVREAARARAGRAAVERARALPAAAVAARVDVHEGRRRRDLPRDDARARLRHDGDPEHPPRPRGPAAEESARLRDPVQSARGRASDHPRAGRPVGLPGVHARGGTRIALRRRRSSPAVHVPLDHALTEIYSYIFEAVTREPAWHAQYFKLSDAQAEENAQATLFLEALLYRRYTAKLQYELGFWRAFPEERGRSERDYSALLTGATGIRYDPRNYLSDMDSGFYSADYLRAWIRSAQLRTYLLREVGDDWWRSKATGDILRELFLEGTRPTSEEVAGRLGFDPLDTGPLVEDLSAA